MRFQFLRRGVGGFRWGLARSAQELMKGIGDLIGIGCAPCKNSFELNRIVGDGAYLHQFSFYCLRISHS